ncbi:phenylalanine--tRNA ligase subunit beta [Candidatus Babeliales bacterium]|nr:phenylalanine--tRNA ligase subunit beta [Candidatus Babeliales bacterium]
MKILLSWLLDYIDCATSKIDVKNIVHLFNIRTAEIESFQPVEHISSMYVARVDAIDKDAVAMTCPELENTCSLPIRSDAVVGSWYLIFKEKTGYRWVVLADFCSETEGIMPSVHVTSQQQQGAWKNAWKQADYVLEVDNKSINHRPDLWGHYGIAREIAAFLNVPFKQQDFSAVNYKIETYPQKSDNVRADGLSVEIQDKHGCSRFAAVRYDQVQHLDSPIQVAIRLALVGIKPMNGPVDLTNYVMCDVGHPMHIFDAAVFKNDQLIIRKAKSQEQMVLLDGQTVKLTEHDTVVASATQVVSLAGIMGGKSSAYQSTTQSIILEAAGFDPADIRTTAQRCKLRTEACMRFEKHLDPMQNVVALQRYMQLAVEHGILPAQSPWPIVSVGVTLQPRVCTVTHEYLEKTLGMNIDTQFVQTALIKLGFGVQFHSATKTYDVTIPTSRATKDIEHAHDIAEEVVRSFGFENIIPSLPLRQTTAFSMHVAQNIQSIKYHLAYSLGMHELRDYMMYDASWISKLQVDTQHAVSVKSPLSENWTTLVTSLIPHLVKGVASNSAHSDTLRFFEWNRTWSKHNGAYQEHKSLAGIIFDKKMVDFYACKAELQSLWDLLNIDVVYQKAEQAAVWYEPHQVAELMVDGVHIGFFGMLSSAWKHGAIEGSACIFELDGAFLESIVPKQQRFVAWSKYQDVTYDISLFVPLTVTAQQLCQVIKNAHKNITDVHVVDFFEKDEWKDHRAVTIRYTMTDFNKTMIKQDLDEIVQSVHGALKVYHVQIR